jgi:hypothetical protein
MDKQLLDNIWKYGCEYYYPSSKSRTYIQRNKSYIQSRKTDCQHCGAKDTEWHHLDKSTKRFNLGGPLQYSIHTIQQEIDKCICLCRSCHAAVHREEKSAQAKRQWAEVRAANPEARNVGDV